MPRKRKEMTLRGALRKRKHLRNVFLEHVRLEKARREEMEKEADALSRLWDQETGYMK